MSFLKIGDRAAGAIKSGGTTRRAAKMVCLDVNHPDIEAFVNWKVREEIKVAALVEGMKQLGADPWQNIARRYPAGTRLFGKVTNIADYGCFVEIEEGDEIYDYSSPDGANFQVICDPKSLLYIYGMQLDFSTALIGGGFNFTNPNATQTCGCGSSFAV